MQQQYVSARWEDKRKDVQLQHCECIGSMVALRPIKRFGERCTGACHMRHAQRVPECRHARHCRTVHAAQQLQPYGVHSLAGAFGLVLLLLLPGAPLALASASAAMCTQSCATSNRTLGQEG